MGKKKKKRAQRKMAASLLPAVRSVEGGDGSAPCSPEKPNTSPGSAATLLAACCIDLFSYSCFTTTRHLFICNNCAIFEAAALSQSCGAPGAQSSARHGMRQCRN